jgi:hypothetical protein
VGSSTILATALGGGDASDASFCRVSGYLKDIHGNVLPGREIVVRNLYIPAAVGSDTLILNELQKVRTNSAGLLQFDVYQGAEVRIELPGRLSEFSRTVTVPEELSADIIDLVFPYLTSVTFDDASLEAEVGEQFIPDATALISNGEELENGFASALSFTISDEAVVEHTGGLSFTALAEGTATITISDVDTDVIVIYQEPDGDVIERLNPPAITLNSIDITVT